ncbi:collagenase [Streptomyces sp. 4503]|uniref:microbial collagenase n=1 Tax=Streptomyces niphimycinicus TaxID=2842201 RepID=A0ABS6CFM8_9ACTN|nr:collagenase [Streptomyces niphimycinicus]MBU3865621.1 collagenase [Streptomyces niphimycinicus]
MRIPSARRYARQLRRNSGPLAALALALTLGGGLLAAPGQAMAAPSSYSVPQGSPTAAGPDHQLKNDPDGPRASLDAVPTAPAHSGRRARAADRPPLSADDSVHRTDYDQPWTHRVKAHPRPSKNVRKSKASAAECRISDFTQNTGDALVQKIKESTTDCVNTLFPLTGGDARGAFREEQMVPVAQALQAGSANYPGDGSTGMTQLVLFLRAGYYAQWYHPDDVGPYGPTLKSAIQGALDAFFAAPRSHDVTDANGATLSEAVILIDSAQENARYLSIVKRLLTDYNGTYNDSYWMVNAVNSVFTVLFRGHQVPEFVTAVQQDPSVLNTVSKFALDHVDLLSGKNYFLDYNAGRELGRFLMDEGLRDTVRPMAKELLGKTTITGPTARLWVGVAEMTAAYDKDKCQEYGTCDLQKRLIEAVLPVQRDCGSGITIKGQEITADQLDQVCRSLTEQNAFFHKVARDNGPVKDDHNETIEVVAFNSSIDYGTYANVIYGIDTNNGGMYLEGDPSKEGNQPRFIAYEADWLQPKFDIWNLNHEYTHYLDGRFDMYGDYAAGQTTPTVWWVEGFAEYINYSYRNETYEDAITEAGKHTYRLSTLFDTTYTNTDTNRTYRWGYLAVRFMEERHPGEVDSLLRYYRAGDWQGARDLLTRSIGGAYDAEFDQWLTDCAAGACKVS